MVHVSLHTISRGAFFMAAALITVLTFSGCKNTLVLESLWVTTSPQIDGKCTEWRANKAYIKKHDIAVATGNDSVSLYVYLSTMDKSLQKQLLAGGLTVWLDDKAKKDFAYGIRFPAAQTRAQPSRKRERERSPDVPDRARVEGLKDKVELLGPEEGQMRTMHVIQANELGLEAGLGVESGEVAIELKLPLKPTDGNYYAVNVGMSGDVCLRLETSPSQRPAGGREGRGGSEEMRGDGGGGRRGGGGGGRHGGGGGMGGKRPGGDTGTREQVTPEPLKIALEITLAKQP